MAKTFAFRPYNLLFTLTHHKHGDYIIQPQFKNCLQMALRCKSASNYITNQREFYWSKQKWSHWGHTIRFKDEIPDQMLSYSCFLLEYNSASIQLAGNDSKHANASVDLLIVAESSFSRHGGELFLTFCFTSFIWPAISNLDSGWWLHGRRDNRHWYS